MGGKVESGMHGSTAVGGGWEGGGEKVSARVAACEDRGLMACQWLPKVVGGCWAGAGVRRGRCSETARGLTRAMCSRRGLAACADGPQATGSAWESLGRSGSWYRASVAGSPFSSWSGLRRDDEPAIVCACFNALCRRLFTTPASVCHATRHTGSPLVLWLATKG
jgi:hypothetical protein